MGERPHGRRSEPSGSSGPCDFLPLSVRGKFSFLDASVLPNEETEIKKEKKKDTHLGLRHNYSVDREY